MIGPTGIWSADEAKPENYPNSSILALKLIDVFSTDYPVIDFGCGPGFYLNYLFYHAGFSVIGIDGFINFRAEYPLLCADVTTVRTQTGQVLSLEVGEHIPVEYEQYFIDNLCRHCDSRMVISWAIEGQNGIGHVNCRNNDYIIDQITKRGFTFNEEVTAHLRKGIENRVRYFRDTLMVFDKKKSNFYCSKTFFKCSEQCEDCQYDVKARQAQTRFGLNNRK